MLNPLRMVLRRILLGKGGIGGAASASGSALKEIRGQAFRALAISLLCVVGISVIGYLRLSLHGVSPAESPRPVADRPDQLPLPGPNRDEAALLAERERQGELDKLGRRVGINAAVLKTLVTGFNSIKDFSEPVRLSPPEEQWLASLVVSMPDDLLDQSIVEYNKIHINVSQAESAILEGVRAGGITPDARRAWARAKEPRKIDYPRFDDTPYFTENSPKKIIEKVTTASTLTKGDLVGLTAYIRQRGQALGELAAVGKELRGLHAALPLATRRKMFGLDSAVIEPLGVLSSRNISPKALGDFYEATARDLEGLLGSRAKGPLTALDFGPRALAGAVEPTAARSYEPKSPEKRRWSVIAPSLGHLRRVEEREGRIRLYIEDASITFGGRSGWHDAADLKNDEREEVERLLAHGEPPKDYRPKPGSNRRAKAIFMNMKKWTFSNNFKANAAFLYAEDKDGTSYVQLELENKEKKWFRLEDFSEADQQYISEVLDGNIVL